MGDTSALKAQIKGKLELISQEREKEKILLTEIGHALNESDEDSSIDKELMDVVKDITTQITEIEDSMRQVLANEERSMVLSDEHKVLNVELRNLKNKVRVELEELGRNAWEYWQSGQNFDGLEDALGDLIKSRERLDSVENAVSRNETLNANLGGSFLSKGRAFFLAGRQKAVASTMERLFGIVGSRIVESLDMERFQEQSKLIEKTWNTLQSIEARKNEIKERLFLIVEEREQLAGDWENLPGKGNARRRSISLEKILDTKRVSLDNAFFDIGKAWMELPKVNPPNPEVEKLKNNCDEVRNNIHSIEEEKTILKATLEYRNLEGERNNQELNVQVLDAKVKKFQEQLKNAKKQLSKLDKQLDEMKESLPNDLFS